MNWKKRLYEFLVSLNIIKKGSLGSIEINFTRNGIGDLFVREKKE